MIRAPVAKDYAYVSKTQSSIVAKTGPYHVYSRLDRVPVAQYVGG